MALDHEAIYEAYKSATKPVVSIDDTAGAFAADGSKVTLSDTKIAAARKMGRDSKTIPTDSMMWQHLDISSNKCDMFAFVGINPDVNYVVRKGWREEFDELFILYFTMR